MSIRRWLVVAMLHLDVDPHELTDCAPECLLRRIPRSAVIAFDELNTKIQTDETIAVHEVIGIDKLHIERFPYGPFLSHAVL